MTFPRHAGVSLAGAARRACGLVAVLWLLLALAPPAHALDALEVSTAPALDLSRAVGRLRGENGRLTVRTAPDADGVVRRIEVRGRPDGANSWAVFALANATDEQVDRLLVAPHHRLAGSGWWRPDMGAARIRAITPSEGFALERRASGEADLFLITLDPGATITFAAELTGAGLPELTLWQPDAWRDRADAFTLFHGIVLGIGGLLAVFTTVLFVVRGQAMFPATAALAWGVLAYVALDFGFVEHIAPLAPPAERVWRAALELVIAAGFATVLFAYLRLYRWHRRFWLLFAPWVLVLAALALVALGIVAPADPALAAGGARVSLALSAALGLVLVAWLALRGDDRAILFVPTALLIAAWTAAAWGVATGRVDTVLAEPALLGGLVLLVLLVAFTVTQHAFGGAAASGGLDLSDAERRALALTASGDALFDWDVARDLIHVDPVVTDTLGLPRDALNGRPRDWLPRLHPADRDRFMTALDALATRARGRADLDLRLRGEAETGSTHHWFNLRARPQLGTDGTVARCVGRLSDVDRERTGRDQLLRDAVHDNLTGLPLREILLDRIRTAVALAQEAEGTDGPAHLRPALLILDLDRFAHVNETFGLPTGDGMLLSVARRLDRLAKPQDCAARLGGDRFALLLLSQPEPQGVVSVAERVRAAVSSPVAHAGAQIVSTASIGVASWSPGTDAGALLADAEIAVEAAKREGGDRITPFRPAMRAFGERDYRLENDLRHAIARDEMHLLFQPIVRLDTGAVAGFEALMRWQSPGRGTVGPADFIPLAERSGTIEELGAFALSRAAEALRDWRAGGADLFVSVNVSSRQLMRHALIDEVRAAVTRHALPAGALKLEVTESLVMANPERAALVLERAREAGAGLALDDFGTGYSSLAHLMRFPFDTLKIDRSLVRDGGVANGSPDAPGDAPRDGRAAVLRAVAQMARDLGLDAVAEGAGEEDREVLESLGIGYAQGFAFGEPMDAKAATALAKQEAKREAKRVPAEGAPVGGGKPADNDAGGEKPVAAE